jgi:hypothetical protein
MFKILYIIVDEGTDKMLKLIQRRVQRTIWTKNIEIIMQIEAKLLSL